MEERKARHQVDTGRCIGCGVCVDLCPNEALEVVDGLATLVHLEKCELCGICEDICEQKAIMVLGQCEQ